MVRTGEARFASRVPVGAPPAAQRSAAGASVCRPATAPSQGAGNIKNDSGITGLTDAQLKSRLPAGFDPAIWGQRKKVNNGYPYLLANPPPA